MGGIITGFSDFLKFEDLGVFGFDFLKTFGHPYLSTFLVNTDSFIHSSLTL